MDGELFCLPQNGGRFGDFRRVFYFWKTDVCVSTSGTGRGGSGGHYRF